MWQMCRTFSAAFTIAAGLLVPTVSPAFDYVSSARLADRCRAYVDDSRSEHGRFCSAYVRGFIDGSPTVVITMLRRDGSEESFTKRAARTRLGRPVAPRAEYCIDGSSGMRTLVKQIVALADEAAPRDDVDASVLLNATFARFHRCAS